MRVLQHSSCSCPFHDDAEWVLGQLHTVGGTSCLLSGIGDCDWHLIPQIRRVRDLHRQAGVCEWSMRSTYEVFVMCVSCVCDVCV